MAPPAPLVRVGSPCLLVCAPASGVSTPTTLRFVYHVAAEKGDRSDARAYVARGACLRSLWMREPSVLIVEDDDEFRALIREALEREGFAVREAHDGQEALAVLSASEGSQCLILLDLMMPGMTGWEFVAAVRADRRLHGDPIVVTTAVPEDAPRAVDAILQKPFDLE